MAGGKWSAFIQKVVEHTIQTFLGGFFPNKVLKVILQCFKGTLKFACGLYDLFSIQVPFVKRDKPPFCPDNKLLL